MNYLTDVLINDKEYIKLLKTLEDDKINNIYVHGLVENSTGHFTYSLLEKVKRPVFVLLENPKRAKDLYNFMKDLDSEHIYYLDEDEVNINNIKNLNNDIKVRRQEVISKLIDNENILIFTTLKALTKKNSSRKRIKDSKIKIDFDSSIDLNALTDKLLYLGYSQVYSVEEKGEFAIRGGIIDIYSINNDPTRIELFGDEVDSIRTFDIQTKRSIKNIDSLDIYPYEDNIFDKDELNMALNALKEDYKSALKKDVNKERLEEKFSKIIELFSNDIIDNKDLLIPYLKNSNYNILDLAKSPIVIFEDFSRIFDSEKDKELIFRNNLEDFIENGELFSNHNNIVFSTDDVLEKIKENKNINISQILKKMRIINPEAIFEIRSMESEGFYGNLENFSKAVYDYQLRGYKVVIGSGNKANRERIEDSLLNNKVFFEYKENFNYEIKSNQVFISDFSFYRGFTYPKIKVIFFSEEDIFGKIKKKRRKTRKIDKKSIINYEDLEIGEYVVHDNYGIGRYLGLENLKVGQRNKDFLKIEYGENDRLYVPAEEMNYISKYIGGVSSPKLSKLGSADWKKSTQKAKKSVEEIADGLVELYADRANIEGYKFSPDSSWQKTFEDSFMYVETPSQLKATEEIKKDMESSEPMDRLLCGDVGYGKTEVALRAAFKAAMDGKQTAFLVPTTILCQQHYETMVNRFKDFPINVDFLSRFKTTKEEKETREMLRKGEIDIIVGTHKLLNKSVKFHDIGLLIIDEEQRFGVKHKEKIKEFKKNIDVLTLSATPIPRTLQMSLTGIRDMSILEEPPEDRSPVNTYVMEFDRKIIRDAILREIAREGQVYFVYNKVYDIDKMASSLQNLVPEASIIVGHGQMPTKNLEKVMLDFKERNYDILLSTTIIETGMDISNVNTMIIYDADKMGLAQLYQLKGRIGRSNRSSYAYFTYKKGKVISELGEERLKAIKDFSSFGSGYKIAMRDLEIRGAGNILGESQSGHIDSVGYEYFVRLLEEEINKRKGIETKKDRLVNIDIKVEAYIPHSYIEDDNYKLKIYKDIANIESKDDSDEIIEELFDIYGDIPKPVINLINIAYIKALALKTNVISIVELENEVYIEFMDGVLELEDLEKLSVEFSQVLRYDLLSGNPKIIFNASNQKLSDIIYALELILKGE